MQRRNLAKGPPTQRARAEAMAPEPVMARDKDRVDSLISPSSDTPVYGGTNSETEDSHLDVLSEEEDDDDDDVDDEGDDDSDELPPVQDAEDSVSSCLQRLYGGIKSAILIVANVENLWDEVEPDGVSRTSNTQSTGLRRRNHIVVLFWFFILAASYAGERSTFKLLVDHAGPFRLMAVEMVTAAHAILLAFVMFATFLFGRSRNLPSLGVTLIDVGLIAIMDSVSLLLVFLTGLRVTPTLTVILVQFTLPLTAFFTQFVHPDGCCSLYRSSGDRSDALPDSNHSASEDYFDENNLNRGGPLAAHAPPPPPPSPIPTSTIANINSKHDAFVPSETTRLVTSTNDHGHSGNRPWLSTGYGGLALEHVWGSLIIFIAVMLALLPACYALFYPYAFYYADPIPVRTAINTLLYAASCIPAAAVTLYKEHIFLQYKQPVRMDYLNLLISVFQFVIASVMSPLLFGLQGLGASGDWTQLYPSSSFSENFSDGLKCFFGQLPDDDQRNKYPEEATCRDTLVLVTLYALSIIFVGVAVDKIVNAGATKVMYRGISAGIIVSVIAMHIYDLNEPAFNYGAAIDGLNLVCLMLLILGSEIYHRVTLPESTFETEYVLVTNIYED